MSTNDNPLSANFIRQIITNDLKENKNEGKVATRFPPEPNGYLHIGHAKSICLNFGIAAEFNGTCNLRFDDTNPEKENIEYMQSIERDVQWLGFEWAGLVHHASDYFEQLYDYAEQLIEQGQAYVDSLSAEQIRLYRGTLTEPGKESPDRSRSIADNLDLFQRMRAGEFADGQYVFAPKLTWHHPISICVTLRFTGFVAFIITVPAILGVFIPCTIIRIVFLMPLKGLLIPCVPWNLKITDHFMIGCLSNCKPPVIPNK